jgi:hypothetical protein
VHSFFDQDVAEQTTDTRRRRRVAFAKPALKSNATASVARRLGRDVNPARTPPSVPWRIRRVDLLSLADLQGLGQTLRMCTEVPGANAQIDPDQRSH